MMSICRNPVSPTAQALWVAVWGRAGAVVRALAWARVCIVSLALAAFSPAWAQVGTAAITPSTPSDTLKNLPLPGPSSLVQPLALRVAYAENPRFAPLADSQIDAILAHAAQAVQAHFKIELRFETPVRVPLADLFAAIPAKTRDKAEKTRLDATGHAPTRERLARGLLKDMRTDGDIPAQQRFATPYLLQPPDDGTALAFARALIATQHTLLATWRDAPARDGHPTLGADRFNEYTYWLALGDSPMAFDVILTNQLIASAEREDNSVHSALRGGVSNGITTQSRNARFQLYSVVSSFPFFDGSAATVRLRGGMAAEADEASRQMGLLLAHELGHLLLHLGHPFANPACVMTPPVRLEFRKWQQGLDAHKCPLADSKANTPGFIKFTRPEILFR